MPVTDAITTTTDRPARMRRAGRVVGPTGLGLSLVIHGALGALAFVLVVASPVVQPAPSIKVGISAQPAASVSTPVAPSKPTPVVPAPVAPTARPAAETAPEPPPADVDSPPQRTASPPTQPFWQAGVTRVTDLAADIASLRALEAQREQERIERERLAHAQAEHDRLEAERLAAEEEERARAAEQAHRERIERELAERDRRIREQQEALEQAHQLALAEFDFRTVVSAAVDDAKFYPRRAIRRSQEGRVVVRFTLARDGSLVGEPAVIEPCRYDTLNDAAVEAVREAVPVRGFPAQLAKDQLVFEIAIVYQLRD